MSEVNQAFLRAYLKNRTQSSPSGVAEQVDANATLSASHTQPLPAQSQVRPRAPQTEPIFRQADQGRNLRIDPSHVPDSSARTATVATPSILNRPPRPSALPTPAPAATPSPAPRQGVWGPLGVERGMKAMESMSVPAVVSNGVTHVTQEASRRQPAKPEFSSSRPTTPPTIAPKIPLAPNENGAMGNVQYDQVMFVDGLSGTPMTPHLPSRKPSQTLEEITEPIAIGTGTQLPPTSTKRTGGLPLGSMSPKKLVQPPENIEWDRIASENQPEDASQSISIGIDEPRRDDVFVNRRFDTPHIDPAAIAAREALRQPATVPPTSPAPLTQPVAPEFATPAFGRSSVVSAQRESFAESEPATHTRRESAKSNSSPSVRSIETLPLPVAFTPSWEVDAFFWPEVVKQIENSHADAFHQIGKHLSMANRDGLRVMAITSGERGVGRSTVAMHMARCAASHGLKVALVDGDTYCPSLIDQLRLDIQHGWQDCLFENVPLSEVAVHSIADRVTLFPLTSVVSPQQMHANLHRMAKMIKRISTAFDMVFIDASRLNLEQRDLVGVAQESIVDAAIVVVDTELSIKEKVDSAVSILQGMGISSIGLVENFQA